MADMTAFEQLDSLIREQKNQIHVLNETLKEVDIAPSGPELVAGTNITLVPDTSLNTLTINSTASGVGEWITAGTQYNYDGNTYTAGINVERFNRYGDEGNGCNQAAGDYSHVEGFGNKAFGTQSHAEGGGNVTIGHWSHVEGSGNVIKSDYGHAEGSTNTVNASCSHAEGFSNDVYGQNAHVEGGDCLVAGAYGHGEGYNTTSTGQSAHAEGDHSLAEGQSSHAEGTSYAYGECSHAEGYSVKSTSGAIGYASHSEGYNCVANGSSSHAEGQETTANGLYSHAEGYGTKAQANYSHAQNQYTEARAEASTAMGSHTIASAKSQLVLGEYNVSNSTTVNKTGAGDYNYTLSKFPFIIGNGYNNFFADTDVRSDAFKIDCDGKIYVGADTDGVDLKTFHDTFDVTSSDNTKVLTASYQNGVGTYSWQDAPESSACIVHTYTDTSLPNKVVLDNNNEYRYINLVNANSLTISIETIDTTKSFYSTIVLHNVSSTSSLSTFVTVSGDSVISNIIFLNEDNVDLSISDTAELLFFTNGMSNTVMCIAYAYATPTL